MSAIMPTYNRMDVAFERGEGVYLFDDQGKRYLDFVAGIAVNALGHCHPHLVETLQAQAASLWHTSNIYRIPHQERLAERLVDASFADSIFFTNSGVEAVECAMKLARKFHYDAGNEGRYRIITFSNAFHGRSLATIAAAGKEKLTKGFGPMPEGFDIVPFADLRAVRKAIGPETAAIMLEPVQGEGGVYPFPPEKMRELRQIADEAGLLVILDEIQCGMGRSGKLFAFEWSGITPDIVAAAKGIGGGFPLGACMARAGVAESLSVGSHGTTYGGNPLAMAVGNAVLDELLKPGFFAHVEEMSGLIYARLNEMKARYPGIIREVRGLGLMIGIEFSIPVRPIILDLLDNGFLAGAAGENVLRLLPPLIIEPQHVDEALAAIDAAVGRAAQAAQ
jgi:acetylornithine/N-succinyldiaminopimelate aminotransferase